MAKYLVNRLLRGLVSIVIVVAIVMTLIYSMMDRNLIFQADPQYSKTANNVRATYKFQQWEKYGYLDYVTYGDYLNELVKSGEISVETRDTASVISKKRVNSSEDPVAIYNDDAIVAEYVAKFTDYYKSQGYEVERLDAVMQTSKKYANGGKEQLYAYKDIPLIVRLWKYFTGLVSVDNIHYVPEENDIGDRGITFTLFDPAYDGAFAPAIMGNGTQHKYLLYFDNQFPFVHQNLVTIKLGLSYSVNKDVDVFDSMTATQGAYVSSTVVYPSGKVEESADDIHSATYVAGSRDLNDMYKEYYNDDYTSVITKKNGNSQMGYSFVIGIISVAGAYLLGVPLGILMSRKKDKLIDKIGTIYIVFIMAVPSLAYIFLFKAIGYNIGLPTTFSVVDPTVWMYVLPIVSLSLPSVANLMKWIRRYMIDQSNADYVKFARSGGLSEGEIFSKHILKNAIIPIVHGIPGSILGALTGAIITERVYVVPGAGNLLTTAINTNDNGVIVGVTLFYASLSVISIILGDIFMAMVDPRISFTSKAR